MRLIATVWIAWPGGALLKADSSSSAFAQVVQPDGSVIELRQRGDEWFHWHETRDGFVVARSTTGEWAYARPSELDIAYEAIDGATVGVADPRAFGIQPGQRIAAARIEGRIRTLTENDVTELARVSEEGVAPEASSVNAANSPFELNLGRFKCAVILAAFDDHWEDGSVASRYGYPKADYESLFNEVARADSEGSGSVRDFYRENSYGKVDIEFILSDWVRLPREESWYGDNEHEAEGEQRARQMARDAIDAAEAAGYDFSQADSNSDDWVDLYYVLYSGHSESKSGNPAASLWPRKWSLKDQVTKDGVSLKFYASSAALRGRSNAANPEIAGIGTIAHEIGHLFGLPDLYDRGDSTEGIGTWGLMGGGSWGARSGSDDTTRPVQLTAFSKHRLGYLDPVVVSSGEGLELPPVEAFPVAHMVRDGMEEGNEYFLLEYRKRIDSDAELPGDGILIWHVDETHPDYDSELYEHPTLRLEEAGGTDGLASDRYATRDQMWRSDTEGFSGFRDGTGQRHTNAMRYQEGLFYERYLNDAAFTHVTITNFSQPDESYSETYDTAVMTYDLSTTRSRLEQADGSSGNFELSWSAATNAERYEVQRSTFGTVTSLFDDCEDASRSHDLWIFGGSARRSSGGAASGNFSYMLSGKDEGNSRYLSEVQSMTLRQSFTMTEESVISLDVMSHVSEDKGILAVLLSNNDGATWRVVGGVMGYFDPFFPIAITREHWGEAGIAVGDVCRLKILMDIKNLWGWSGYPNYGFAIDNIGLANVTMAGGEDWRTIDRDVDGTSLEVFTRSPGDYAYRVRAFVAGEWRPYSVPTAITSSASGESHYSRWVVANELGVSERGESADPDGDGVQNLWEFALGRNPLVVEPGSELAWGPTDDTESFAVSLRRGRGDVGFELQVSNDLLSWEVVEESASSDESFARFEIEPSETARFVRVRAFSRY